MKKIDKQPQIHIARISMDLDQDELSEKVNKMLGYEATTSNMLSKIETGWRKTVPKDIANALCKCLNMTIAEFTKRGIVIHD